MSEHLAKRPTRVSRTRKTAARKKDRGALKSRIVTALLIFILACLFTFVSVVFYVFFLLDGSEVSLDSLNLNQTSVLYYHDGADDSWAVQEKLYISGDRTWVSMSQIPEHMRKAAVAIEDKRFYSHKGVDWIRTGGAVIALFTGQTRYGGSTITQQLIKNVTEEDAVSIKRKLREIVSALELERNYSKDQILEYYLNTIYLGQNVNGVQAAAKTYFGKDVSELSLAESASIIGITQFPGKYDPYKNPENNKEKQELIIEQMYQQGMIDEQTRDEAIAEELHFIEKQTVETGGSTLSYYTDQVIEDVISDLMSEYGYSYDVAERMVFSGGLSIYTCMDKTVQDAMESVFVGNDSFPTVYGTAQPEAAMVVMDPNSGAVVGIVGGVGEKTSSRSLNRATQTTRQPGSSIKPLSVYAPAIEKGIITEASVYDDSPLLIESRYPKNQSRTYSGLTTVKTGVARSLNTVAVKVLADLGFEESYDFITENLHVTSIVDQMVTSNGAVKTDLGYGALGLGGLTNGISVLESTAAYVPFSNGGVYYTPYTYSSVVDSRGNVLLENKPDPQPAMSEQTAYIVNDLLLNAVNNGTGTSARLSNVPVAGKTGTTSDDYDRWFVGYTPYYCAAVWYGFDANKTIVTTSGTNPALSIWRQVMVKVHSGLAYKDFFSTDGIVTAEYCLDSGKIATAACKSDIRGSRVATAKFIRETAPDEECDCHVMVEVCEESNQIVGEFCENTKSVGLLNYKREFPYSITITDAQYTFLPGDYALVPGSRSVVYQSLLSAGMNPGNSGVENPVNYCCHIHTTAPVVDEPVPEDPTVEPPTDVPPEEGGVIPVGPADPPAQQ